MTDYGMPRPRDGMIQRGGGATAAASQGSGYAGVALDMGSLAAQQSEPRDTRQPHYPQPAYNAYGATSAPPPAHFPVSSAAPAAQYPSYDEAPSQYEGYGQDAAYGKSYTSVHSSYHTDDLEDAVAQTTESRGIQVCAALCIAGVVFISLCMGSAGGVLCFVHVTCTLGIYYALFLAKNIILSEKGDGKMQDVASAIREASTGFLQVQYGAIARVALGVAAALFFAYFFREATPGLSLGPSVLATLTTLSFLLGALCSALAGYVGVWISVRANLRVAQQAVLGSVAGALKMAFHGGAFSAIISACMCMMGLALLYAVFHCIAVGFYGLRPDTVPRLLVGYGFGASFVALFMQVAGGIYTKAADVGADMVGKVDKSIPEDDPRNPAVIADLVGDNVGDCAGSMADVFESIAAEILGTMILAGALCHEVRLDDAVTQRYIFFPLIIHALDVLVSSVGIAAVKYRPSDSTPLEAMKRGYLITAFLATVLFTLVCYFTLSVPEYPDAWYRFWLCGLLGIATAFVLLFVCQYYTDYAYAPVKGIALASLTGHGTNVIQGLAVGFESTGMPACVISINLALSFYLGEGAFPSAPVTSGLFGTAVATMGILCTAVFILSMNNFGPIADNAGGIVEMSDQTDETRETTDSLDAIGNVTKAATKGYSVGGSAMAFFLLFRAFMDDVSEFSGETFEVVNIAKIEVLIGGLLGVSMIFVFTGWTMRSVGVAAQSVVLEVRRQFDEIPGIMEGTARPEYAHCTAIVTKAALKEAAAPVALALSSPVVVGLIFRLVGYLRGERLLAVTVLAGFMMFGSVTALLLAAMLDNAGGAWDNAKKYIESGQHGGKGSDAHKAAVTGDTVGDPAKDTSGPSLHVVITTMSTTILVLCPIFISPKL